MIAWYMMLRSRSKFRWAGTGTTVVALMAALAACGAHPHSSESSATPHAIRVVAGENFWGDIASQIGGRTVTVTSLITNPNMDPHLYETNAANAIAVAKANVVILNGLGYDTFMDHLLGASTPGSRIVVRIQDVLGITDRDANPHVWYDILRMPAVAGAIEAAIARSDPADRATFERNLATFDASLRPILGVIRAIKTKYHGAAVAYTERVPGYLVSDCGLEVETPLGFASAIEDGSEPSAADSLAMYSLMNSRQIKVLLVNRQTVSAVTEHVEELAQRAGIPIVAVRETMPPADGTYQNWQLEQAKAILAALGG